MAIPYDEPKRALNLREHGFDFADFATHFDASNAVFAETAPSRTGRERFLVVGLWSDGRIVTAILSPLGTEAWSLVSLRTASEKERRTYAQHNPPE
ncbi:hypothetical protein ASG52_17915 [Methylobacterium sp. Leaf456]|uniref:BrnT family toxin n=1 Tax=Methylobacterium sp. Leaf456 TaxID=1736382 RepID=UPI0006FC9B18|nr:BrnT family toxin [Methylobacterium sp. Leaf456]KQT61106.1 hypothetical protein ASG52_17915 [Methylobacterium sp. Leaf456]